MAYRSCFQLRCGYVTSDVVEKCPRCGSRMRTSKQVRLLGFAQLVLGLFLIGFMGAITFYLAPLMLNPAAADAGTSFTGTSAQAKIILILFGLVMAFGAGSGLSGLWQIVTGRRNKWITLIALAICALLIIFAYSFELIFELT